MAVSSIAGENNKKNPENINLDVSVSNYGFIYLCGFSSLFFFSVK
jgi:hypothetical protein